MRLHALSFSVLVALLMVDASAQASSLLRCETSFVSKTRLDSLIVETDGIYPHLSPTVLPSKNGSTARILFGRLGASVDTFEEVIDLSKEKLEGFETRKSTRNDEGQTLDLHVRLRTSMNDIWKVSLASEMDAFAFLLSAKLNLKQQLIDSFDANGFVLKASSEDGSPVTTSKFPDEVSVGTDYKIVGIETAITRDHHKDSVLILKLENVKTAEVIEVASARTAQGLKAARQILSKGNATLKLQGRAFVLEENLNPGRLAPRSSAL